ncbi:hypothetical protein JZO76_07150 [Enterococcus sp. MJM12]|uniref:Lipoprotein n=1 Tax=Candidatus Enterococcus myersii TaxID=2815322 RepID=A0ABS3H795_9ENTE|nr:hypothetical protein [Enterococcus sp. MJM12]MBO0449316.1 hypothetical protein [Enterococcus sp. MJM12]
MKKVALSLLIGILLLTACSSVDTIKYQGVEVEEQHVNNIERVEKKITKLLSSLSEFNNSSDYDDVEVTSDAISLLDEFEKIDTNNDLYDQIETLLISNENEYSVLSSVKRANEEKRPMTSEETDYIFSGIDSYITGFSKLIVYNYDDYKEMEEIINDEIGIE